MRLISITKQKVDSTNLMEGNFNEDILIKPKSQIAVQNCMFQYHFTGFTVDATNDYLEISYRNNPKFSGRYLIYLPRGQYNDSNAFFTMLKRYLNSNLTSNPDNDTLFNLETGFKWDIQFSGNKNVKLLYNSTGGNIYDILWKGTGSKITITTTPTGREYTPTVPITRSDCYIVSDEYFINSCGVMECQVDSDNCDFAMGLVQKQYDYATETVEPETESLFAVVSVADGAKRYYQYVLRYKLRGWITRDDGTKIDVLKEDVIDIVSEGDKNGNFQFIVKIYRNAKNDPVADLVVEFSSNNSTTYFYGDFYYGYISLRDANAAISYVAWNKDPEETPNLKNVGQANVNVIVDFSRSSLGKDLGFSKPIYSSINLSQNFISENPFKYYIIPQPFIIETMNLPVDSYNSVDRKRSPIIATIPKLSGKDEQFIHFEPNQLNFINLNNQYPFQLRDIQLRITDTADTTFILPEGSSITLLIKDEDDS